VVHDSLDPPPKRHGEEEERIPRPALNGIRRRARLQYDARREARSALESLINIITRRDEEARETRRVRAEVTAVISDMVTRIEDEERERRLVAARGEVQLTLSDLASRIEGSEAGVRWEVGWTLSQLVEATVRALEPRPTPEEGHPTAPETAVSVEEESSPPPATSAPEEEHATTPDPALPEGGHVTAPETSVSMGEEEESVLTAAVGEDWASDVEIPDINTIEAPSPPAPALAESGGQPPPMEESVTVTAPPDTAVRPRPASTSGGKGPPAGAHRESILVEAVASPPSERSFPEVAAAGAESLAPMPRGGGPRAAGVEEEGESVPRRGETDHPPAPEGTVEGPTGEVDRREEGRAVVEEVLGAIIARLVAASEAADRRLAVGGVIDEIVGRIVVAAGLPGFEERHVVRGVMEEMIVRVVAEAEAREMEQRAIVLSVVEGIVHRIATADEARTTAREAVATIVSAVIARRVSEGRGEVALALAAVTDRVTARGEVTEALASLVREVEARDARGIASLLLAEMIGEVERRHPPPPPVDPFTVRPPHVPVEVWDEVCTSLRDVIEAITWMVSGWRRLCI
jgi:hypothetical protein